MTMVSRRVAKATGIVLFYEQRGLIPEPEWTASGYRQYSFDTATRIRIIKNTQGLGFSLKEISELLDLQTDRSTGCKTIKVRTSHKTDIADNKIKALKKVKKSLKIIHDQCRGKGRIKAGCAILKTLGAGSINRSLMQDTSMKT